MSIVKRIRNRKVPGVAWLVVGVTVTALALPTAAYAGGAAKAVLKFTGIEGTSTNKADVTASGQLLTTEVNPGSATPHAWGGSEVSDFVNASTAGTCVPFENLNLPSNENFILTELQIDVNADPTPGAPAWAEVFTDSNCSGTPVTVDNPPTIGNQVVPILPNITTVGPDGNIAGGNGNYLSLEVSGGVQASATANGYIATV